MTLRARKAEMAKRRIGRVAASVVLLVVSAGCSSDGPVDNAPVSPAPLTTGFGAPPNPETASYVVNFASPSTFKELGVRILTWGSQDAPPAIADGVLAQGSSLADKVASYFERQAAQPVREMGLQVEFPPSTGAASAVAMILADGPLPDRNVTWKRPNLGMHFVATAQFWQLDVWPTDGDLQQLAGAQFDTSKFNGPLRYQVERDGDIARVVQPDGKTFEVRDPRIEKWSGKWMTWELFQDGGNIASARIQSWWAT
jgi:hypothetical protein